MDKLNTYRRLVKRCLEDWEAYIKRARHNSYRVKRASDHGLRYTGPPTIKLANLGRWPQRPSLVRALRTVRHYIPVVTCGIQSDAKPTAEIASPTAREGQIGQGKYFSNRIAPATTAMMTMFMVPIMTSTSISPQQQPMQYAAWRRPACRSRSLPRRPVR